MEWEDRPGPLSGPKSVGLDALVPGPGQCSPAPTSPCHLHWFLSHPSLNTGQKLPHPPLFGTQLPIQMRCSVPDGCKALPSSLCKGPADETEALVCTAPPSRKAGPTDTPPSWRLNCPVFCQTNKALHFYHKLVHTRGLIDPPVCLIHQVSRWLGREALLSGPSEELPNFHLKDSVETNHSIGRKLPLPLWQVPPFS